MYKYTYNPSHFHAAEGVLFTARNAYDETIWEELDETTDDIDHVFVRILHPDNTIDCYYELVDLLQAYFEEGLYSAQIMRQFDSIYNAYVEFCERTNTSIPDLWKITN